MNTRLHSGVHSWSSQSLAVHPYFANEHPRPMGFIPDSFIGVWQHRRAWVPFINRRAIEMRFSCGNSSSGEKAFSVFVRRFEQRSTKMNSRVQVQGFIHENVKMWCKYWSFYQWKGFFHSKTQFRLAKMKVKVIQNHWKHNVDIIKMNTELIAKFKKRPTIPEGLWSSKSILLKSVMISATNGFILQRRHNGFNDKNVIKFQKMSVHLRPHQAQKAFQ